HFVMWRSSSVLIGEHFTESRLDYLRRPVVTVREQMPIDIESDGGGGVAEPTANRNRVHASGDELARMGVAERGQAYRRQLVFDQSADPFARGGIRASCSAIPASKDKIAIARAT